MREEKYDILFLNSNDNVSESMQKLNLYWVHQLAGILSTQKLSGELWSMDTKNAEQPLSEWEQQRNMQHLLSSSRAQAIRSTQIATYRICSHFQYEWFGLVSMDSQGGNHD